MRYLIAFLFFLSSLGKSFSQDIFCDSNNPFAGLFLDSIYAWPNKFHTSISPFDESHFSKKYLDFETNKNKIQSLQIFNSDIYSKKYHKWNFAINPILSSFLNFSDDKLLSCNQFGLRADVAYSGLLRFNLGYYYSIDELNSSQASLARQTSFVPFHSEYAFVSGNSFRSHRLYGSFVYTPFSFLDIEAGIGRNFFGDGYRSLFLSDVSDMYPYLKISAEVWHLKYVVLYQNLRDVFYKPTYGHADKRSTSHVLSWNITKRININLFETVVYSKTDSIGERGAEFNYYNPLVIFRPVEFSIGSPDNVLLGVGARYNVFGRFHLYGQFLMDEFHLEKIKETDGYWANKFGLQSGFRWFRPFGLSGLMLLGEVNTVRPFTYSHEDAFTAYGNSGKPLAHPLGANFREFIFVTSYQLNRFGVSFKCIFNHYGVDVDSVSVGQNIYRSYEERGSDEGHRIAQGLDNKVLSTFVQFDYLLNPKANISCFVRFRHRLHQVESVSDGAFAVSFGFRTNLYHDYLFED